VSLITTRVLALALTFALAPALPACRRAPEDDGAPRLRLGYFATLAHAQAVLGVSSGEYAKAVAPARLEATVFNAGPSLVEALFAGHIDVGYVGPGPALTAHRRSGGRGVRVVAGAAANGVVLVVRKDSGTLSLADLAGKKIATPQIGGTQDLSARHFVDGTLKRSSAKAIVPLANAEQTAMMARGEIDAAWVPEPWGERLVREAGACVLAEEKDLWPKKEFLVAVVITTPDYLAAHHDVVDKLLAAHAAWTERLAGEHGVDAWAAPLDDALGRLAGKKLPAGVLPAAMKRVKFTTALDADTFRSFAAWSYDLGFEREPIDVAGLLAPQGDRT
jgi:NitT/TauT family transport system substrate-binding protein